MLESLTTDRFEYQKLSPEEQQKRGILGRLVGPMASYKDPTRNERKYSEKLWEKVFNDPIMKEKIENKCAFGELGHPTDRTEVDMEKIAICLADFPKKGKDGLLYGVFDILDTPNGRLLKCLCDYGCNVGVSSRGEGDLIVDYDGGDEVDPDTFMCECWDAVLLPAVKAARPTYVSESLDTRNSLNESLDKLVEKSSEKDKKIITETIGLLDISEYYQNENSVNHIESTETELVDNIKNAEDEDLIQQLQESLLEQQRLKDVITNLQEQLSVSYAKETKFKEELDKHKKVIVNLTDSVTKTKGLSVRVDKLQNLLNESTSQLSSCKKTIAELTEEVNKGQIQNKKINQKLFLTESKVSSQKQKFAEMLQQVKAQSSQQEEQLNKKSKELEEQLQKSEKDYKLKCSELQSKLTKTSKLVEKYKSIAVKAVDKYINSKAIQIGVSTNEIYNKLSESYTFTEIDKVCEDLRQYKLNISKLPFNSQSISKTLQENARMQARPSKNELINPIKKGYEDVDIIDDQLLNLADQI